MPSSIVLTAKMWKRPARDASITSSLSIRLRTLARGMITPCSPVSPRVRQILKYPSIFCVTPPTACTSPRWLTEPVTAIAWRIGAPARLDSTAYSSVEEALSPSTSSYICSKQRLAFRTAAAFFARPVTRLDSEIAHAIELRRKPVLILRPPATLLDEHRHRVACQRRALRSLGGFRRLLGIEVLRFGSTRHVAVEVRADLEQLPELAILSEQQAIGRGVADHDDLDMSRNRLGSKRRAARGVLLFGIALEHDFTEAQQALDGIPRARVAQQVARIHDQEAAVRTMERARLYHHVVGIGQAVAQSKLNTPDEVAKGGIDLAHDGRAVLGRVVCQHIDAVAPQQGRDRRARAQAFVQGHCAAALAALVCRRHSQRAVFLGRRFLLLLLRLERSIRGTLRRVLSVGSREHVGVRRDVGLQPMQMVNRLLLRTVARCQLLREM